MSVPTSRANERAATVVLTGWPNSECESEANR